MEQDRVWMQWVLIHRGKEDKVYLGLKSEVVLTAPLLRPRLLVPIQFVILLCLIFFALNPSCSHHQPIQKKRSYMLTHNLITENTEMT